MRQRVFAATEWVVLLALLLAATPPILIRHKSLTVVGKLNLIDDSWVLDTSYKAANGIWFGRDVAFTYGPIFQWLSSGPSRWLGISTGVVNATWYTLPFFVIILSTFLTARLLLPGVVAWRRALFLLLAVVFWSPPDIRVSLCLLAFAIFVRLTDVAAQSAGAILPHAIAAAAICIAAFLVSADTGLYSTAAFLLCVAATAIAKNETRRLARFLIATALCFALLMVLTDALMFSPLNFAFWRSGLAIAKGYRWFEPLPMVKASKWLLLASLALGIVVFAAAWRWRQSAGPWTRRPAFLLSGFCVAFLMMQSGVVRSDHAHVLLGIYPIIFLCGLIAMDEHDFGPWLSVALLAATVIATLALAHPYGMFFPRHMLALSRQIAHPVLRCPEGMQEFDRACFSPEDAHLLSSVSGFIDLHTAPREPIGVLPYETAFGLTSRRQVAGGVLQSYLVNGEYLTALELAGLRQARPHFGLYFPDGILSIALDGVPNFTRSPDVWFYFLRHYRAEGSSAPGVLGLVRDDSRDSRLIFVEQTIADVTPPVQLRKRRTTLDFGAIRWPPAGADFLKLRLRVNGPLWWRLRKPSQLTLQMLFSDGTEKSIRFVVEPNHTSDIWVYPWDDKEMGRYFSADESEWRPTLRPALTGLKLILTPFDWISVGPNSVGVGSIKAVQINLR